MLLQDLAELLADDGVGDYATDRALDPDLAAITLNGTPAVDGDAVALELYAGPEPDSRNGWELPRLQVRVRAADPTRAYELDRAVFDVLQARGPEQLASVWLQDCHALQSAPMPLGQDRSGRWEFSRNYQLTTKE